MSRNHIVVQYDTKGNFLAVMSGMGKNKGTWDSTHSRSAAYRHAASLRKSKELHLRGRTYKVEETC